MRNWGSAVGAFIFVIKKRAFNAFNMFPMNAIWKSKDFFPIIKSPSTSSALIIIPVIIPSLIPISEHTMKHFMLSIVSVRGNLFFSFSVHILVIFISKLFKQFITFRDSFLFHTSFSFWNSSFDVILIQEDIFLFSEKELDLFVPIFFSIQIKLISIFFNPGLCSFF